LRPHRRQRCEKQEAGHQQAAASVRHSAFLHSEVCGHEKLQHGRVGRIQTAGAHVGEVAEIGISLERTVQRISDLFGTCIQV
jgi:hypothetical protein